jgi:hypothetical protein
MAAKPAIDAGLIPTVGQWAALYSWRGQGGQGGDLARTGLASAHAFTNDILAAYQRASGAQLETLLQTNERMAELFAQLAAARAPEAVLALQLEVASGLSQAGLASVTAWADLARRLAETCSGVGAEACALLLARSGPASEA